MDISLFDYNLPEDRIAQSPCDKRDNCKLMVLNRAERSIEHRHFYDILSYLKRGDVLVRNNTKVLPSRLIGSKKETGGKVEVLLLRQLEEKDCWECLCGNARRVNVGTVIVFGDGRLEAVCTSVLHEGLRHFRFVYEGIFLEVLESLGKMPLPPYIKKQISKNSDYQTVYAKVPGSAAAPTAGFHFTTELLKQIEEMGIEIVDVTLNIGLGTFRPVKVSDTKDHVMHTEEYQMTADVADKLNKAKAEGRRIIAVGTTSVRTLESVYGKYGKFAPCHENTSIFIYPGIPFKATDALITNFHLPKSTLVMLVSAFAGRNFILDAYKKAIENDYRFFSFGDAMFIYGDYDYTNSLND